MRFAAAGLLLGFCISAIAQDAVVVEATRFPEDVRRLPASATVIDAGEIARSPARTLPELLSGQAGLVARDLFGNNAAVTAIDLRGFGATGPQNTLVLLDGRRLSDLDLSSVQWSAIPLPSIERIEILRGAGAVLYGDAASAGVINIVTRSPLKQGLSAGASGRVGAFDTREGQLYAAHGGERFGINASLDGYESDGYRDNNRNRQRNGALNMRWALGEGAFDLRFGLDQQDLRLPGVRRVQPSLGLDEAASDRRGTATPNDFSSRDGRRAGAALTQRFGDVELSLGLDYREKDQRIFNEPFFRYQADRLELRSLTPRMRVPLTVAGMRHSVTTGADWHDWRYRSRRADQPANGDRPANRLSISQRTRGFYVQDVVDLSPATVATLGYRRERAKYKARDRVDLASPACFFCTEAPAQDATQEKSAWEAGLRQRLTPALSLYGRLNRGIRFVTVDEIYEFSLATFSNQFDFLRPQSARTREAGVEWRAGGHALRAALFDTRVKNEIHLDPIAFDNVNLPRSRRRGLELEGRWQALESLRLDAAYTRTEARFAEGRRVPLVPANKVNLAALWRIAPRTELSAVLAAVGAQRMENDETNTFPRRIPAYATTDVKLAQRFGWGRVAIAVHNAFDREYFAYAVNSTVSDLAHVYPLPGRTFSLLAEVVLP